MQRLKAEYLEASHIQVRGKRSSIVQEHIPQARQAQGMTEIEMVPIVLIKAQVSDHQPECDQQHPGQRQRDRFGGKTGGQRASQAFEPVYIGGFMGLIRLECFSHRVAYLIQSKGGRSNLWAKIGLCRH